jgi:beta-glucosidase/6-phospho-beta-glucosidase/beta-galactosidase
MGSATASFQIEGSLKTDGPCPFVWDIFQNQPGTIVNSDTADVVCNSYNQYKEDIQLIKSMWM